MFVDHLLTKHKTEKVPETMARGGKKKQKNSKQKAWFVTFSHEVIYVMCN